jgi:hypothetical protein
VVNHFITQDYLNFIASALGDMLAQPVEDLEINYDITADVKTISIRWKPQERYTYTSDTIPPRSEIPTRRFR